MVVGLHVGSQLHDALVEFGQEDGRQQVDQNGQDEPYDEDAAHAGACRGQLAVLAGFAEGVEKEPAFKEVNQRREHIRQKRAVDDGHERVEELRPDFREQFAPKEGVEKQQDGGYRPEYREADLEIGFMVVVRLILRHGKSPLYAWFAPRPPYRAALAPEIGLYMIFQGIAIPFFVCYTVRKVRPASRSGRRYALS